MRNWWLAVFLYSAFLGTANATDLVANIPDTYSINGANPNGSTYGGEVTITTDGELYYFRWRISGGQTFRGKGRLRGRTLTIDWGQNYPVIYLIKAMESRLALGLTVAAGKI